MGKTLQKIRRITWIFLLFTLQPVSAAIVTAQLPNHTEVSADYREGNHGKTAVLVLHGFMTTYEFNTVQSMVNQISELGYTVLAPTLSLGINNRHASLPCDAIHTHTMEDDLAEVEFWVKWLVSRGYRNIVLVGHSSGSLQLAIYVSRHPERAVRKVIATSLVNMQQYTPVATMTGDIKTADELRTKKPPPLHQYHLVYCADYTSTPQSYLSYIEWSRNKVLETLQQRKVPIVVIMGGSDKRFGPDWITSMRKTGVTVNVIPGATHFFDTTHELELLDQLELQLKSE